MVKLYDGGVYLVNGREIVPAAEAAKVEQLTGKKACPEEDRKGTIAYSIMKAHNTSDDMDNLLTLLGAAGCNYFMGVPGADDVMLNYQSTSFHDSHYLRQVLGLRPAPEFEAWLERMGVVDDRQRLLPIGMKNPLLQVFKSE